MYIKFLIFLKVSDFFKIAPRKTFLKKFFPCGNSLNLEFSIDNSICNTSTYTYILLNRSINRKELNLCHKLFFSKPYIFGFQCRRPQIFQTMNSVRSNNISLKYKRFTTLDSKAKGIKKSEFVTKTQFLSNRKFLA